MSRAAVIPAAAAILPAFAILPCLLFPPVHKSSEDGLALEITELNPHQKIQEEEVKRAEWRSFHHAGVGAPNSSRDFV